MTEMPMTQARKHLGTIVRQAATRRERTTITDHGQAAAVLVNPQELADLEEALALALYRVEKATGEVAVVGQDEVRRRLGLPRT